MVTTDNTTLLWTGSITNETLAPALAKCHWHRQGAEPKTLEPSTSCQHPARIDALREDFADHFRSKISDLRLSLLQQVLIIDTSGSLNTCGFFQDQLLYMVNWSFKTVSSPPL